MALFDRRLLAYFDDGLSAGGSLTLLDRIADYQRDLAEIERELSKYQVLLGNRQVQFKHRDRESWIVKNREHKTIKERYRKAAQQLGQGNEFEKGEDGHRNQGYPDEVVEQSRRGSVTGKRGSVSKGQRGSITGTGGGRSAASTPGKGMTVWVQIDTIFGLPARSSAYSVRAQWVGQAGSGHPETEERAPERDTNGDEKCVVRQQLKLEEHPGATVVRVTIHGHGNTLVGAATIHTNEESNFDVQNHQLHDEHGRPLHSARTDDSGRPVPSTVRLRLTSAATGTRHPTRASTFGGTGAEAAAASGKRPSQARRASDAKEPARETPVREERTEKKEEEPRRRNSRQEEHKPTSTAPAVTQDAAVAPQRRNSSSKPADGSAAGPSGAAKAAAAGAVGVAGGAAAAGAVAAAAAHAKEEDSPSRPATTPAESVTPAFTDGGTEPEEEYIEEEEEESSGEGDEEEDEGGAEEYEEGEEEEDGAP